jgi:hypothetical protein
MSNINDSPLLENEQLVAVSMTLVTNVGKPFVRDTLKSVIADPGIVQIIICGEERVPSYILL